MMTGTIRRRALSLALALSVALAAPPGVGLAADEPDLKLEDVRMFASADGQVSESVVQFKVTNVGSADSVDWTGRLEVTGPPPVPEPGEPFTVEKLEKNGGVFQGRLPLPAPCDGTVIRFWVQAPGETNFDDNTVEGLKLCPNKPPPPPAPAPAEVGSDTHELEFAPSALRSMSRNTYGRVHRGPYDDSRHPDQMWVGWDAFSYLYDFRVSQMAVNFDLTRLLQVNRPLVTHAHLSFIEHEQEWADRYGDRTDVLGCVARLDFATNDWRLPPRQFMSSDFLFRGRYLTDGFIPHTQTAGEPGRLQRWRAFDVTSHVLRQLAYRDDPELWFGYVLRGGVDNPEGALGACMSRVSRPTLWVTYVDLSN